MEWLHPAYLWTLLAVPLAVGFYLWAAWRRRQAYRRLGDPALVARLAAAVSPRRRRWKAALVVLAVGLLGLALAGPRFGTHLREVKQSGVDLVIALDVSLSMQAEDVAPNRLERARNEIKKMLDGLHGARVGLVLFAGDAFIQCPLTTDYNAVRLFLDVAEPSLIPTPGTDFGAALRMALKAFEAPGGEETPRDGRTRALLFVSDGENHIPGLDDLIDEARRAGVVLFAAGVGETEGAVIPIRQPGRRVEYKKDGQGNVVTTRLEEETLQSLATDGAYFRIARTSSSLSKVAAALDELDPAELGKEAFEEYAERYQWPLALALLFLAVEPLIRDRRRRPA
ncbi:MAG: VWA domain-containing protein [Bacteroidetes bacterium]|nr:MAG: VWA domain-containing protein [Bacteroidota bacterium]